MTEINWYVDGLKPGKMVDYDEIQKIMESYYKYNRSKLNMAITLGSSSSNIYDTMSENRRRLGASQYYYSIDLEYKEGDYAKIILNYAGQHAVKNWKACLIAALGDMVAHQFLNEISVASNELMKKYYDFDPSDASKATAEVMEQYRKDEKAMEHFIRFKKALGAYCAISIVNDYNAELADQVYSLYKLPSWLVDKRVNMDQLAYDFYEKFLDRITKLAGACVYDKVNNLSQCNLPELTYLKDTGFNELRDVFALKFDKILSGKKITSREYNRVVNVMESMCNSVWDKHNQILVEITKEKAIEKVSKLSGSPLNLAMSSQMIDKLLSKK